MTGLQMPSQGCNFINEIFVISASFIQCASLNGSPENSWAKVTGVVFLQLPIDFFGDGSTEEMVNISYFVFIGGSIFFN